MAKRTVKELLRRLERANDDERRQLYDELITSIYTRLLDLARRSLRTPGTASGLEAPELVNEVYLRLIDQRRRAVSANELMEAAAAAMRQILVDEARRRPIKRRTPDLSSKRFENVGVSASGLAPEVVLDVDRAIDSLPQDAKQVTVLKVFGRFGWDEIAAITGQPVEQARAKWRTARARLALELSKPLPAVRAEHPGASVRHITWQLRLAGSVQDLGDSRADLLVTLRTLTGDRSLNLLDVEPGSVILTLEGSEEGYRVLRSLVDSGQLREVLGMRVEHLRLVSSEQDAPTPETKPAECDIFISYSHRDQQIRQQLSVHLTLLERQGLVRTWHDRKIAPGIAWASEIDSRINRSHIILALVSPDFIASEYCYGVELKRALELHAQGRARLIPIIVRPVDWQSSPLGQLQALPPDSKPITRWPNRDMVLSLIATELRKIVQSGLPAV